MATQTASSAYSLSERDRATLWHPFTQMQTAKLFPAIERAEGSYLYTADGNSYLDGTSSWWVNLHGHSHPYIMEKIQAQLKDLQHVSFGDFTHPTAVQLAERLLPLLPGEMAKIFFSDNGATAIETALKMALQYWHNQKLPKTRVVCFRNSYHGDTFGAMSASGKNAFNRPFWKYLFQVERIDVPFPGKEEQSLAELLKILKKGKSACFIFEPLALGPGGMLFYPPKGLDLLLEACKKHQVLTIADEVMTGFGRTGTLFACDQLKEKPDILCLSKGLTGGYLPLAVTACSEAIYSSFLGNSPEKALLHGHSYTGNPLACSAALASLDLLLQPNCIQKRKHIAIWQQEFCQQWRSHPKLHRCETLGTILALTYRSQISLRDSLYHFFLSKGILLRPLGNVVYVLPPYCMQQDELQWIYQHIIQTLNEDV